MQSRANPIIAIEGLGRYQIRNICILIYIVAASYNITTVHSEVHHKPTRTLETKLTYALYSAVVGGYLKPGSPFSTLKERLVLSIYLRSSCSYVHLSEGTFCITRY